MMRDRKKNKRWKSLGRFVPLGKYDFPLEALRLAEDIQRLEAILAALYLLDVWNITDSETQKQRDFGDAMLRSMILLVRTWLRYAKRKMATQYLAQ